EMFAGYFQTSMLAKARTLALIDVRVHNIRDFARGKHRITDEPPYGGGGGMVLIPGPIFTAVESIISAAPADRFGENKSSQIPIILLTPQGRKFDQTIAKELKEQDHLIFICGRYEGVDERIRQHLATDEISIGDYVMTGGELAALVVVDAVARLIPGVLGAEGAELNDSFEDGLLEGPHYTHPRDFRGWLVPDVLQSGDLGAVKRWRRQMALRRTWQRRPDLLLTANLTEEDKYFLAVLAEEASEEIDR
ncbi:MAG: tRNA (guanosine(37)-N1)-methyltransferase TrmD, partial [Candidatus Promineifilaceae bacterium]